MSFLVQQIQRRIFQNIHAIFNDYFNFPFENGVTLYFKFVFTCGFASSLVKIAQMVLEKKLVMFTDVLIDGGQKQIVQVMQFRRAKRYTYHDKDFRKCMVKLFMRVLFAPFFPNTSLCNQSYITTFINTIVVLIVYVLIISINNCVE